MSGLVSPGPVPASEYELEAFNLGILSQASTGAAALRGLYEGHKNKYRHMSFGYIMRRSGISSKGYLSHVMSGARRLNPRYQEAICEVFKLSEAARLRLQEIWLRDELQQRDRRAAQNTAARFRSSVAAFSEAV